MNDTAYSILAKSLPATDVPSERVRMGVSVVLEYVFPHSLPDICRIASFERDRQKIGHEVKVYPMRDKFRVL